MLTKRQHEALSFIAIYKAKHDISPSYEEIRANLKISSNQRVFDIVKALKERGYVTSDQSPRSIEIIKAFQPRARIDTTHALYFSVVKPESGDARLVQITP